MDKSAYKLTDLHRILFGNAPIEFMAETLFRTVIIYIFLLAVVAWLGKRMSGQMTITELGIAIMLGAIVAPPMETPERGIIQGIMILLIILVLHRNTARLTVYRPKAEKIIQGSLDICIIDGIIDIDVLRRIRVSRAQLFAMLRTNQIYNLGQIERLYMEASGIFSIFPAEHPRPGLSLLPPDDDNIHHLQHQPDKELKACISCGNTIKHPSTGQPCQRCGNTQWLTAVL